MRHRGWSGILATFLLGSACTIQNYYPAPAAAGGPVVTSAPGNVDHSPAAPEAPPAIPPSGPAPEPTPAPPPAVVTGSPLPVSSRGQILYSPLARQGTAIVATGPLLAMHPDAPDLVVTVQSLSSRDYVLGRGLVGGYDTEARQFWTLDLRSGHTTTLPAGVPVDGLATDGRVVARCAGGLDDAFELCTVDGTGHRTTVMTEAGIYGEAALVESAGGTRVLGDYANLTRPPFIVELATGERRDLPGLRRADWKYLTRPIISSSGALAAHCFVGDKRDSLVVADLSTRGQRAIDLGELTRCECKFSPDDRMLACGILPAKRGWSGRPDQLITVDLASGAQRVLSSTMLIAQFAFSPDSRELVYVAERTAGSGEYRLGIIGVNGGETRDLAAWGADKELVGWIPAP